MASHPEPSTLPGPPLCRDSLAHMSGHSPSGWRTVGALVTAYLRGIGHRVWRGTRTQRGWRALAATAGVGFWLALFFGTQAGVELFVEHMPFAPAVLAKATELLFLVLLGTVAYSSVLVALVHVYLARDVRLLASLPASNSALFVAKWVEVAVVSGWAPVSFGTAVLWGLGAGLQCAPAYYVLSGVVLTALITIPPSLAMGLTAVAVNVFPANRTRDVLVFLSLVLLLGLFVAVRSMDPERAFDPKMLTQLSSQVITLELPGGAALPSTWAGRLVGSLMVQGTPARVVDAALLGTSVLGALMVAWLTFLTLFRRGLSTTLTARGRWMGAQSLWARLIGTLTNFLPRNMGAIARKDLLQFARDPSQWSQLLLLGALVLIYMLNLKAFPLDQVGVLGITPRVGADVLAFINIAFVGFVLTAVSLRFLFSAVSLEGRAAWVVLTSPLSPRRLLLAKLIPGTVLLMLFGAVLVLGSNWILRPSGAVGAVALLGTVLVVVSLSGLGVGLGAIMPNFDASSPARIATSAGGLMHMLIGLAAVLGITLLLAAPCYLLRATGQGENFGIWAWVGVGVSATAAVLLSFAAVVIPLRLGERALSGGKTPSL